MSQSEQFLTIKEAAKILNVHSMTIYRWAKKGGVLPMFKVGGSWRCRKADLEKIGLPEVAKIHPIVRERRSYRERQTK